MLRLAVLAGAAATVLAADLVHKAAAVAAEGDALLYHERSGGYALGILVAAAAWCGALLLTGSASLAFAGGLLLGAATANSLSILLWTGVPDPFVVGGGTWALAFNLADVAVLVSVFAVLPLGLVAFVRRNRGRLGEPVSLRLR